MELEAVIGLEIHTQLRTHTKLFCSCPAVFGGEPNSRGCPVCLGMPGALPVLNQEAVRLGLRTALAVGASVNHQSVFARKNYFYPDLPKGYQISQYEEPLCQGGELYVEGEGCSRHVALRRIHIEEDAGKLIHDQHEQSLFDVNRCGTPLIEIVTEPQLETPRQVFLFLTQLKQLLQYLDVCDGNMEEGSLRCDANISMRPRGQDILGTKTELKNMNSFHNVEKAVEYEIQRQRSILSQGGQVEQETLLWDPVNNKTRQMRSKENAHDYRYFPDPDLRPLVVASEELEDMRRSLPELPQARRARFVQEHRLPDYDAGVLTQTRGIADYFENCVRAGADAKQASNWIMSKVLRVIGESSVSLLERAPVSPEHLARLIRLIGEGVLSGKMAGTVFDDMVSTGLGPDELVRDKCLAQVSDAGLIETIVKTVVEANQREVEQFRAGKEKLLAFFVGQVMKATSGKANPVLVNESLLRMLKK